MHIENNHQATRKVTCPRFGTGMRTSRRHTPRKGYTLFEVLLVLGLILVAVSLIAPRFLDMYQRHRLREVADEVRQVVAAGRNHATETGVIYQFQFQPGGNAYRLAPFEPAFATTNGEMLPPSVERMLPETYRFELSEGYELAAPISTTGSFGGASSVAATSPGQVAWSPPILFAPHGSATEAMFCVVDAENQQVEIAVRGLTGAVSRSEVAGRLGP